MSAKVKQEAQNPLILRCHRLMEAFAKSDDERDFYIDRLEGFLLFIDLDKPEAELEALDKELKSNPDRYLAIPKLSFYETKKIMEGFVNEKVYDIDTKEKLLDIIQSKEARENFLEFIYDHHSEQEKWHQFYQERSRIRIIEWLRANHFHFVFEEDLELPRIIIEKLKQFLFQPKVAKDILTARKTLVAKAKTYYSNEALNPRPKRGRPPKQAAKPDIEPQVTTDIYINVTPAIRPFLFSPELTSNFAFSAFSSKFDNENDVLSRRLHSNDQNASLTQKLATLRSLSNRWVEPENQPIGKELDFNLNEDDDDFDNDTEFDEPKTKVTKPKKVAKSSPTPTKKAKSKTTVEKKPVKAAKPGNKPLKRLIPKTASKSKPQR